MRTGKTQQQIDYIREHLNKGETIFMGGMKDPTDYLNRLGEGYSAQPHYAKRSIPLEITYSDFYRIDTIEYLPTVCGYVFRKV